MAKVDRNGKRKLRSNWPKRTRLLGYYYVVTNTEKTESNYIEGLRDSLPPNVQGRIIIKVKKDVKTKYLITACKEENPDSQYRERWIIFDRDREPKFDTIIAEAEDEDIHVAWSNPCFEIWLCAYFEKMPNITESSSCCREFERIYKEKTGQLYSKSDKGIYYMLNKYGDEAAAIKRAQEQLEGYNRDEKIKPSEMCPCTKVHELVKEIRSKIL